MWPRSTFGVQVSSHRVEELCRDVERELKAARLDAPDVLAELEAVRHRSERFFKLLLRGSGRRLGAGWMDDRAAEETGALLTRLDGVRTALLALRERTEPLTGLAGRAQAPGPATSRLGAATTADQRLDEAAVTRTSASSGSAASASRQ
jgi:hypothetical protein